MKKNFEEEIKDLCDKISSELSDNFSKEDYDPSIKYFEKYKNLSEKYETYLNSQDKSINPFLKKSIYIPVEFYKPLYFDPVKNLQKIHDYTYIILMDFVKIKENRFIREGFFDRINWRTSMLQHYIQQWLIYRPVKKCNFGGEGEDIAPLPEETTEVSQFIKDKYSGENESVLNNKKLSVLRKMNICCRKLIELSPDFDIKLEVKLQLLWKKYKKVLEIYPYEEDF